jgi:hypothetical protein
MDKGGTRMWSFVEILRLKKTLMEIYKINNLEEWTLNLDLKLK